MTFVVLSAPCFADYDDGRKYSVALEDCQDVFFSSHETELLEVMQNAADEIGANIGVVLANSLNGLSEEQYSKTFLESSFGSYSSSIVLMLAEQGSGDEDWIYATGPAYDVYKTQFDNIFDAVYYGLDSGVSPNYDAAIKQFCGYLVSNKDGYSKSDADYGGITYLAELTDYQNALSASEKEELLEVIQSTADNIGANIGVVLSDSLNGKSESSYTDDFLKDNFGWDSSSIVLMLVKKGTGNQDWISTSHHAYDIYNPQLDDIFDAVYSGLDSGSGPNYPAAIRKFCAYLESHKTGYNTGGNADFHFGMGHLILLASAAIISCVIVSVHSSGYKKKKPISARTYIDNSRTNFIQRNDIFIREFTTSHRISSSSSGGSGHSGGGGGHSRSGGHGGGGGRRR